MKSIEMKILFTFLTLISCLAISGCKNLGDLGIKPVAEGPTLDGCQISRFNNSIEEELNIGITYNEAYEPVAISGFSDFNELIYEGNSLKGARNNKISTHELLFDFDKNGILLKVNFKVDNSLEYVSKFKYDKKDRLEEISVSYPIFRGPIVVTLEYDKNDNVTFIKKKENKEVILENISFDDQKSPFLDQKMGQILMLYMVVELLTGEGNYTAVLNKNNVTASVITIGDDITQLSSVFKYNSKGYPTSVETVKTSNGRLKSVKGSFEYLCD